MSDDITIPLKRTPLWSNNLSLLAAVAAAFTVNTLMDVGPRLLSEGRLDAEATLSVGIMMAALLALLGTLGKRALTRRHKLLPIVMSETAMRMPVGPESGKTHQVPYSAIIAVGEGGRAPKRHFFIESGRRIYHLPQELFEHPAGPEVLFVALRARLQGLPSGTQQLADTERQRRDALQAMGVRPMVTHALLGINGVFFLNTWLKGALELPFGLLRWGANAPALVYRGEVYRLAAASFLHGHWLHITMNMLALWYLGGLMERLLGWARFSLLYLLAGALAMAATAYNAGAVLTVGASGAIFGLLGAFAVLSLRLRRALPMGVRQTPRWWVSMLLVNTCIPLLWPVVDSAAHIAGFVAGALLCGLLLGTKRQIPGPPSKPLMAAACLVMLTYAAALGQAVVHAAHTTASQEVSFSKLLLADVRTPASTLNTLAWLWMADPASTQEHLLAAKDACHEAVQRDPSVPEYRATLGMVCQRLKLAPCATDAWYGAMTAAYGARPPGGVLHSDGGVPTLYAYQFARVLGQELRHNEAGDTGPHEANLPLQRYRDSWSITTPSGTELPPVVWLLAEGVGGTPVALVQWRFAEPQAQTLVAPPELSRAFNDMGVRTARIVYLRQKDVGPIAPPQGEAGAEPTCPWTLWRLPAPSGGDTESAQN